MISPRFLRFSSTTSKMVSEAITNKVKKLINEKPVFIASKTYCPYCKATKQTFSELTKEVYILELDEQEDGADIQAALAELTGQKTVPNVFIKGEHIGGNSDVQALKSQDKLESKVKAAL